MFVLHPSGRNLGPALGCLYHDEGTQMAPYAFERALGTLLSWVF